VLDLSQHVVIDLARFRPNRSCQYRSGHTRHSWRQQRTVFERVRDMLTTCLRPASAGHASLRPGFRPARLMEFGLMALYKFNYYYVFY